MHQLKSILLAITVLIVLYTSILLIVFTLKQTTQRSDSPQTTSATQAANPLRTFYVSPQGNDNNPGNESAPWKTMKKAADTLQAGDMAIFENGTYLETQMTPFVNGGTAANPIVYKARNKFGAKIVYSTDLSGSMKIRIAQPYLEFWDFDITQETFKSATTDTLFTILPGGSFTKIIGNRISNARVHISVKGADGVQLGLPAESILIDGNTIFNGGGILMTNALNPIISNNDLYDINSASRAIAVNGGTRSARIFNNYIHLQNSSIEQMPAAIALGSPVIGSWAYCKNTDCYNGYNSVVYNNIISMPAGKLLYGILNEGCNTCLVTNNVVIGSNYALVANTQNSLDPAYNWGWQYCVKSPQFKNNIVVDATAATSFANLCIGSLMDFDYNLFFNTGSVPAQVHKVLADPQFVNKSNDWHLQSSSPAISAGTALTWKGFAGETIDISLDRDSKQRGQNGAWDLGAYEFGPTGGPSPTSQPSPTSPQPTQPSGGLKEDIDGDGCIGILDFNAWFQAIKGNPRPNTFPDINKDGFIDLVDFNLWFRTMKNGQYLC